MLLKKNELLLLVFLFTLGLLPRLWRINTDLQIHYDQGMHSFGVWSIWHDHRLSLLGHPTDVIGITHGPLYYWLMLPSYLMGGGNPIYAAVFQISLHMVGVIFLYLLAKELFDSKTAFLSSLFYSLSYGYASYSRWLSNVTPTLPFSIFFFWCLWQVQQKKFNFYLPFAAFFVSVITQHNGAIGVFLYPILLWVMISSHVFSIRHIRLLLITLIFLVLPHVPLLLFEIRHNLPVTRSILDFGAKSSGGLGLSAPILLYNSQVLFKELYHLTSFSVPWLTLLLLLATSVYIFKHRRSTALKYLSLCLLIFFIPLLFFKRGAIGFFFTPLFPLFTILFARVIFAFPKYLALLLAVLVIGLNLHHWQNFTHPTFALTPIGTPNLLTHADRKAVVDWIYHTAQGRPFAIWIYTIPYFHDEPWTYYFAWYGQSQYGYQPQKTGSFSPSDIPSPYLFFSIYEPDANQPNRLKSWLTEVHTNFGPAVGQFTSQAAIVQHHVK